MDLQWIAEADKLKEKAAEFADVFARLQALEPVARSVSSVAVKFQSLMDEGVTIRERIKRITGLIDDVLGWFTEQGSEPPETIANLQGLGILWVPIAIVAGAVAAITAWLSKAYVQIEEIEAAQKLIEQGVPANEAFKMVRERKGFLQTLSEGVTKNLVLYTALGLATWYIMKQARD